MQSLKDLRKASAARQQLSRTGGDAAGSELTSSIELGEASGGLAATTGAAGAAAGAPRVGRTLAPLTSAGSLVQATSRDDDPTSDGGTPRNKRDDAIQETRRRRRRRRRDREQQQRHDDSRGGANEEDGATPASGTSRISTAVAGEEGGATTAVVVVIAPAQANMPGFIPPLDLTDSEVAKLIILPCGIAEYFIIPRTW